MPESMSIIDSLRIWAKRITRDGLTLWFAGKHPPTPWLAKALGVFVVAYALSPINLIPDFIPVLAMPDKGPWELYNLNEDWSQANDLAAAMAQKLAEMKDVFLMESVKNKNLPIGGGLW